MFIKISLFALILIFSSCTNTNDNKLIRTYFENGQVDFENIIIDRDRSIYKTYYPSGGLKDEFWIIFDSIYDGPTKSYYENGNLEQEGFYVNGLTKGIYKFYYPSGKLKRISEYVITADSPYSSLNQIIFFNEMGDTLKENSFYVEVFCVSDTISINEVYDFFIKLNGAMFDSTFIHLGNYDSLFSKIPYENHLYSFDKENVLILKKKDINYGWNYIRGKIINYETLADGAIGRTVELFYLDSFYVKKW